MSLGFSLLHRTSWELLFNQLQNSLECTFSSGILCAYLGITKKTKKDQKSASFPYLLFKQNKYYWVSDGLQRQILLGDNSMNRQKYPSLVPKGSNYWRARGHSEDCRMKIPNQHESTPGMHAGATLCHLRIPRSIIFLSREVDTQVTVGELMHPVAIRLVSK